LPCGVRIRRLLYPSRDRMSGPNLPLETLDYIADLLHDKPEILKQCCLVSKSWIPRIRKHLFAHISFYSPVVLESWKKTFPDRSTSPAYHTQTLFVGCPEVVTVADAGEDGWIRTFSGVMRLVVRGNLANVSITQVSLDLAPFHGFSPVLKYFRISLATLQNSQIFDLISSLPTLEDMSVSANVIDTNDLLSLDVPPSAVQSSASPPLIGTLHLALPIGAGPVTRRLLALPGGVHFRNLVLSWSEEADLQWLNALVAGCSGTLEYLTTTCYRRGTPTSFLPLTSCNPPLFVGDHGPASIDLSKGTKLKEAVFLLERTSDGLPWHSELSRPNIEISDGSPFACSITLPSPASVTTSGKLWESCFSIGGWSLTAFSFNYGSRTRFVRRSRWTKGRGKCANGLGACCRK